MLPLDLFVTPYQGPGQQPSSASGFNMLGDFGTQLRGEALQKRQLDQRKAEAEASNALGHRNASVSEAWHREQTAARREASRNALEAKRDERVSKLMGMLNKAENDNRWDEAQAIREELTRLGYATDESDTAFVDPADQAKKIAEAGSPALPTPKVSPKQLPKTPAGEDLWLKPPGPEFGFKGAEKPEAPQLKMSPFPWEGPGAAAPPAPAAPPKKKGGRFTTKDREGNIVRIRDVPMEQEKDRQSIEASLAPYIDDPQNPEAQAAMRRASAMAQKAIATGTAPDQARREALQAFKAEMQRYKTQRLPSAPAPTGGPGGGMSKEARLQAGAITDDTSKIIDQLARDDKLPALSEARRATQRGLAMLQGDRSGFRDVNAMGQLLAEMSGKQVSDAEYGRYVGGGSAITRLETKIRSVTAGGKLPDDLISELREVFLRASKIQEAAVNEMGDLAYDQVKKRIIMGKPEDVERQAEAARDYFKHRIRGASGGEAKPSGDRRKALDDKLKGMGL